MCLLQYDVGENLGAWMIGIELYVIRIHNTANRGAEASFR